MKCECFGRKTLTGYADRAVLWIMWIHWMCGNLTCRSVGYCYCWCSVNCVDYVILMY